MKRKFKKPFLKVFRRRQTLRTLIEWLRLILKMQKKLMKLFRRFLPII
nr:MAG TPA: hypothetical protein [Caudoviricetes sp.]